MSDVIAVMSVVVVVMVVTPTRRRASQNLAEQRKRTTRNPAMSCAPSTRPQHFLPVATPRSNLPVLISLETIPGVITEVISATSRCTTVTPIVLDLVIQPPNTKPGI